MKFAVLILLILTPFAFAQKKPAKYPMTLKHKVVNFMTTQAADEYFQTIDDQKEFDGYWAMFAPKGTDVKKPKFDFKKNRLVVLHTGEKRTGGYSIVVKSVKAISANEVHVQWYERTPGRGDMVTQALTYPSLFFEIPKVGKKVMLMKMDPPKSQGK
jgi:hypothetical protein